MSEKLLLLPDSKSIVWVHLMRGPYPYLRLGLVVVGLLVVLVGAADVMSRIANATFGDNSARQIFAPAVVLVEQNTEASSTVAFVPVRLKIPSLGVDASVEEVGNKADGSMDTPKSFSKVAWYKLGSKPGEQGNAVFAGHVNNALMTSGVFAHLKEISVGDYVSVADISGKIILYRVTDVEQYRVDEAPASSIFTTTGTPQLVLITCDGEWSPSAKSFDKRLVVFAKQI